MALNEGEKRGLRQTEAQANRDDNIGSPEHLRATFSRAAAATDRAVGLWLSRSSTPPRTIADVVLSNPQDRGITALRVLVRASATAYVRRLREQGVTPERMLVLVKSAAGPSGSNGFGARELTNDVVHWSIEAYFDT